MLWSVSWFPPLPSFTKPKNDSRKMSNKIKHKSVYPSSFSEPWSPVSKSDVLGNSDEIYSITDQITSELESALENHYGFHKKNNWTEIKKSWPDFPSPSPCDFLITWLPSFSSWLGRSIAALKVKRGQPSFFQWYYEEASEQINHLHWQDQPCLAAISHVSYQWVGE